MEKRKYTKIQTLEAEIVSMHEDGETHREIAEHFGLERIQVKKCMERFRLRQRKEAAGISAGDHPSCYAKGEEEGRCGVAAPQRPGWSVYVPRVF